MITRATVVVVTANHYWLDAAVALTLLAAILLPPARTARGRAVRAVKRRATVSG